MYDLFFCLQIYTTKLLGLFNVGLLGLIILGTALVRDSHLKLMIVDLICALFSVCVFVTPLWFIIYSLLFLICVFRRQVIRTKSVEFIPFSLSFFLTICATMWFFYGLLIKDFFFFFWKGNMHSFKLIKNHDTRLLKLVGENPPSNIDPHLKYF